MSEQLCCENCGSTDIEVQTWVNVLTDDYTLPETGNDEDDQWCCNCEEHVKFCTIKEFEKSKK